MGGDEGHEEDGDGFVVAAGVVGVGIGLDVLADAGEGAIEGIALEIDEGDGEMGAVGPVVVGPGLIFEAGDEVEDFVVRLKGDVELGARRGHGEMVST